MHVYWSHRRKPKDAGYPCWQSATLGWYVFARIPLYSVSKQDHIAYAAACAAQANVTFTAPQTALALPAFWDGPTGIAVPIGALVVIVGAGGMMGFGFIYMLSNM